MTVKNLEHLAIFEGEVVMTKGDLTITADRAEVTFDSTTGFEEASKSAQGLLSPRSGPDRREISLVHATGNVVVRQGDKRATSSDAYYYQKEEKVILTGDPVIWENEYQVTGIKMTLYLHENRSVIEGSKVKIHPKGQGQ